MAFAVLEKTGFKLLPHLQKWSNNRSFTCSAWMCAKITVFEQLGLPEPPKKPLTPYLKFVTSVKPDGQKLSLVERSRVMGVKWESMPIDEKAAYLKLYQSEREEYNSKYSAYINTLTDVQKDQIKHLRKQNAFEKSLKKISSKQKLDLKEDNKKFEKPKQPKNSFQLYLETLQRKEGTSIQEFWVKGGRDWQALGAIGQLKYKMEAQKLMEAFREELQQWEHKMVERGRSDLVRKSTLLALADREDVEILAAMRKSTDPK